MLHERRDADDGVVAPVVAVVLLPEGQALHQQRRVEPGGELLDAGEQRLAPDGVGHGLDQRRCGDWRPSAPPWWRSCRRPSGCRRPARPCSRTMPTRPGRNPRCCPPCAGCSPPGGGSAPGRRTARRKLGKGQLPRAAAAKAVPRIAEDEDVGPRDVLLDQGASHHLDRGEHRLRVLVIHGEQHGRAACAVGRSCRHGGIGPAAAHRRRARRASPSAPDRAGCRTAGPAAPAGTAKTHPPVSVAASQVPSRGNAERRDTGSITAGTRLRRREPRPASGRRWKQPPRPDCHGCALRSSRPVRGCGREERECDGMIAPAMCRTHGRDAAIAMCRR